MKKAILMTAGAAVQKLLLMSPERIREIMMNIADLYYPDLPCRKCSVAPDEIVGKTRTAASSIYIDVFHFLLPLRKPWINSTQPAVRPDAFASGDEQDDVTGPETVLTNWHLLMPKDARRICRQDDR